MQFKITWMSIPAGKDPAIPGVAISEVTASSTPDNSLQVFITHKFTHFMGLTTNVAG